MTLNITEKIDEDDCDPYTGYPYRLMVKYVCRVCDGTRCTLLIEDSYDTGKKRPAPEDWMDHEIRMPCPISPGARFKMEVRRDE